MRDRLILTTFMAIVALAARTVHAQEVDGRPAARIAPGVAYQGGIFGDDHPLSGGSVGVTIGAQVSKSLSRATALVFEGTFQPVGLENPHFDEQVNVLYVQIGPELGRRIYIRPSGGAAVRLWSGSRAESGMDFAPALGVAIGVRAAAGARYQVSPEFFARASMASGAFAALAGIQVPVGPRR